MVDDALIEGFLKRLLQPQNWQTSLNQPIVNQALIPSGWFHKVGFLPMLANDKGCRSVKNTITTNNKHLFFFIKLRCPFLGNQCLPSICINIKQCARCCMERIGRNDVCRSSLTTIRVVVKFEMVTKQPSRFLFLQSIRTDTSFFAKS